MASSFNVLYITVDGPRASLLESFYVAPIAGFTKVAKSAKPIIYNTLSRVESEKVAFFFYKQLTIKGCDKVFRKSILKVFNVRFDVWPMSLSS